MIFCSQLRNEVEDGYWAILADPRVPHALKRACTWSELDLSGHVGARHRERQVPCIQWLWEQVEEREVDSWPLACQLQQLHMEREETALQQRMKAALGQAIDEREVLHG